MRSFTAQSSLILVAALLLCSGTGSVSRADGTLPPSGSAVKMPKFCGPNSSPTCCDEPKLPLGCKVHPPAGGVPFDTVNNKALPVKGDSFASNPMDWALTPGENRPRITIMEFGFPSCPPCQRSREVLDLVAQRCSGSSADVKALEGLMFDKDSVDKDPTSAVHTWQDRELPSLVAQEQKHAEMYFDDEAAPGGALNMNDQLQRFGTDASSLPVFVVLVDGKPVFRMPGGFLDYSKGTGADETSGKEAIKNAIKVRAAHAAHTVEAAIHRFGGPALQGFSCSNKMADGTELPTPPPGMH